MPNLILRSLEKNNTIKKTVLQAYDIRVIQPESSLTNITDNDLKITQSEMFRTDTVEIKQSYKILLREPISPEFTDTTLTLRSFYMKILTSGKVVIRIKGVDEDIVILNITTPLEPFQVRTYNMPIFQSGGVYETLSGNKVNIVKLSPADITRARVVSDDPTLIMLNNMLCDWSLGFSIGGILKNPDGSNQKNPDGTDKRRYIDIDRDAARDFIYTMSNLAYALGTKTMQDCADHFTYLARCIAIEDVADMSYGPQTAWYHLDVTDPFYNPNDKKRFFDRMGATDQRRCHWRVAIDTEQAGVGSYGGPNGGGWMGLSRGAFNQSYDDSITYIVAHEFGHARGWQHGSMFAYGAWSDRNNAFKDMMGDVFPITCKTLLRMRDLPYLDQFANWFNNSSDEDRLRLTQLESKIYMSILAGKSHWWNEKLLNFVNQRVKDIEDYTKNLNGEKIAEKELVETRTAALQEHLDNWLRENGGEISNKSKYESWRSVISAMSEFSWIHDTISGLRITAIGKMNQKYTTNDPVGELKRTLLKRIAIFDPIVLLNPYNFSTETRFFIQPYDYIDKNRENGKYAELYPDHTYWKFGGCYHTGHIYSDKYFIESKHLCVDAR